MDAPLCWPPGERVETADFAMESRYRYPEDYCIPVRDATFLLPVNIKCIPTISIPTALSNLIVLGRLIQLIIKHSLISMCLILNKCCFFSKQQQKSVEADFI